HFVLRELFERCPARTPCGGRKSCEVGALDIPIDGVAFHKSAIALMDKAPLLKQFIPVREPSARAYATRRCTSKNLGDTSHVLRRLTFEFSRCRRRSAGTNGWASWHLRLTSNPKRPNNSLWGAQLQPACAALRNVFKKSSVLALCNDRSSIRTIRHRHWDTGAYLARCALSSVAT